MRFQPGQSGNPSGRPKLPPELRAAINEASVRAVTVLTSLALEHKNPRIRILAADKLLQRGFGKAVALLERAAAA